MCSLRSKVLSPRTEEAGSDLSGSLFPLEVNGTVTAADFLRAFPLIPPKNLVTLFILAMCDTSVSPHRLCYCGCGEIVTGREKLAGVACRKRVQRQRDTLKQLDTAKQCTWLCSLPCQPCPRPLISVDFG